MLRGFLDWLEYYNRGSYSESGERWLETGLVVGSQDGYTIGHASGLWRYRVRDDRTGVVVLLNAQGALVRLAGDPLTVHGLGAAREAATGLLARVGSYRPNAYPARADFALDLMGAVPAAADFRIAGAGRPPKPSYHGLELASGTFETCSVGRKGTRQVVVYNKTLEMETLGQAYRDTLRCDWAASGRTDEDVWRIEARLWREALKANGLTLDTVIAEPWRILALGLSWVTPNAGGLLDLWEAARNWTPSLPASVSAARRYSAPPDDSRLLRDFTRIVANYAALHGLDSTDATAHLLYGLDALESNEGAYTDALTRARKRMGVTANASLDTPMPSTEAVPQGLPF